MLAWLQRSEIGITSGDYDSDSVISPKKELKKRRMEFNTECKTSYPWVEISGLYSKISILQTEDDLQPYTKKKTQELLLEENLQPYTNKKTQELLHEEDIQPYTNMKTQELLQEEDLQPYTSKKALELLHEELIAEIEQYAQMNRIWSWRKTLSNLRQTKVDALYHWTSFALCGVFLIVLLVAYSCSTKREASAREWLVIEAVVIFLVAISNLILSLWNSSLERQEVIRLVRSALDSIQKTTEQSPWSASNFPHLFSPLSPCVSLQWTFRNDQLLNVPIPLLVKGDIILLRPGQTTPARCKAIEISDSTSSSSTILSEGEIYAPDIEESQRDFQEPTMRSALKAKKFILLETPFLKNLRLILEDHQQRPRSVIEHERFLIISKWIERRIFPFILVVMVIVNVLRHVYLRGHVGEWTDMILVIQVHTLLPLVPLLFPVLWHLLNLYGQAKVFTAFEAAKGAKPLGEDSYDSDSSISADEARVDFQWSHVLQWFKDIVLGRAKVVTRRVNLTHILGSVTTLCCIDKKGILSWPNPSAEKLFFLRGADTGLISRNSVDGTGDAENVQVPKVEEVKQSEKKRKRRDSGGYGNPAVVEVLDITHDQKSAFGLHFDDPSWKKYLSSLKPLGLNILANTCNLSTGEWYTQFTDHVACAALENEDTVSVVNKRCLCELAREIGFSEQAIQIFELENSVGMYRQVSAEETTKEKLQRAKSFVRHKIPMPNMVSVIVRENVSGVCQLLSQGTADILLDCCSDYWNGEDIAVLTENDRKKIVDFYHRSSMAAYCTAFSYRPFSQHVSKNLEDFYIELPDKSSYLAQHDHLNQSIYQDMDLMSEPSALWERPRAFSMDSLFENTSIGSIEDADSCYQSQCNQTFIGMVTMQYQARQDFVQMIDKLELACIRFVHFSQENEVRSRIFSEKMGLEAGWNCHISLLSDNRTQCSSITANTSGPVSQAELSNRSNTRYSSRRSTDSFPVREYTPMISKSYSVYEPIKSRSYSAPSMVNLDSALVKFESIVKTAIVSARGSCMPDQEEDPEKEERVPLVAAEGRLEEQHETEDIDDVNFDSEDGESRHTSSYFTENTEDSFTGGLDNRAKLPRGIQNIRPHLRSIDNVPLLVNLFTDCTPETTLEMISIMQEYGEVVLCMGSSVNIQNTPIFLQADSSLAIEPMYPQMCVKQSVMVEPWDDTHITPIHLASILLSIPCPLVFRRDDNTSVIHLIAEARTHLMLMRNCFYFMLCCHLSVSLVQLLSSMLLLPVAIDTQHLLWLLMVIIPLLSLSMMGNTVDPRIMGTATGKNKDHISTEVLLQFIVYFLVRFLPPTCVALLCYGLTLHSFCLVDKTNSTNCTLYSFMSYIPSLERTWYEKYSGGLVLAQNVLIFLLVLYFCCLSVSFIHWTDHIWEQPPTTNRLWLITVPLVLLLQCVFCVCDVVIRDSDVSRSLKLSELHPAVWAVGLIFPIIIVLVNELVKHREIKLAVRYQKRARLAFGTKLGMNSPF